MVFLAALAFFGTTMCRTVYWYDSAEFAAAAAVLGIPHPPGYPLYTLLGRLYVLLLPGEPAVDVNTMSAVHGALGIALLFFVQRQLGADRWGALLGALALATSESYRLNSSVAEVYTTGILFLLLAFALVLHGVREGRRGWLVAAAFVGGLGFSAHMFVATAGLGFAWLVWLGAGPPNSPLRKAWRVRRRTMWRAALGTLAGADQSLWLVTGGEYKHWFLTDYDLGARLTTVAGLLNAHLTPIGFILGTVGLVTMLARERALGT